MLVLTVCLVFCGLLCFVIVVYFLLWFDLLVCLGVVLFDFLFVVVLFLVCFWARLVGRAQVLGLDNLMRFKFGLGDIVFIMWLVSFARLVGCKVRMV